MMDWSGPDFLLVASAAAMALAGGWHCALMCGPICATLAVRRPGSLSLQWGALLGGRLLGYAAAGGVMASAASWGSAWVFRGTGKDVSLSLALWALAQAAALSFGLWLLWTGRQPAWGLTRNRDAQASPTVVKWVGRTPSAVSWGLAGCAWVLLPCGLLQSALVLAALASNGGAGAAVMSVFALLTVPGLVAAPGLLRRWSRGRGEDSLRRPLMRLSGALLTMASAWALGHGLWVQVRDYC